MVVFFWIPGFFIVAVLIMALAVGVEVLQFVQNHILIISALLWLRWHGSYGEDGRIKRFQMMKK